MSKKGKRNKRRSAVISFLAIVCAALVVAIVVMTFRLSTKESGSAGQSQVSSSSEESSGDISSSGTPADVTGTAEPTQTPTPEPTLAPVTQVSPDAMISTYAYMVRLDDGSVALDKSASETMYPASMTKIMTAIVVLDNISDLEEKVQVTQDVLDVLYVRDASVAGFVAGEMVSVRDLLYGVLLPSGGDACITLANRVAGSEEAFAALMNQKAAELGLVSTNFSNSTGLHEDDLYTTCAEMAKILECALQYDTFYEIVTSASHTCEATEQHPEGLTFYSTLFSHITEPTLENGAVILGGKTGTTNEAGYCLASFGTYEDSTYIMVTGHAPFDDTGVVGSFEDAKTAYGSLR